jgi:mannitol-1-phosphate 5-dehydrogenase
MSCVIFGAGKIARGFIGHLLYLSHIPFVFVEKADSLVDLINERKCYTVNILGASEKNTVVKNVKALKFSQEEEIAEAIAEADCVFDAVGGKNLAGIVPFLVKGIEKRAASGKPLNCVTCENWKDPATLVQQMVLAALPQAYQAYCQSKVGFSESVILRSGIDATPEQLSQDPLWVNVQDYWHLPVDATRLKRPMPEGMMCVEPLQEFGGFLQRKFYTYNSANGTTSYVGALLGYTHIAEAAHDPRIVELLDGVYKETAKALSLKQNFPYDEQWAFTRTSLAKLQDYNIVDTIERNARDPIRKLGKDDRLVGSANLCLSEGIVPEHLAVSIAAAIYYHEPTDPIAVQLETMRKEKGVDYILANVCSTDPKGQLGVLVKAKIVELEKKGWIKDGR